ALELVGVIQVLGEPCTQLVEEEGLDGLEDVGFGRVMLAELAAGLAVLDGLEQRPEDRGADLGPVERACLEQEVAHPLVEGGDVGAFGEDAAVDIGEASDEVVEVPLTSACLAIHGL